MNKLLLPLLFAPTLLAGQCAFTAEFYPLSCSTHPNFMQTVSWSISIYGGVPPYYVYANGVNLVATYNTASVNTVLDAYDCAMPFTVTDGSGCSDNTFTQNETIIPEPADFIVPYDLNGDSGVVFDPFTGLVDMRITSTNGIDLFTTWDGDYQYDLSGPATVTGMFASLPMAGGYRYIPDLPQGNYTVTMTNTGTGIYYTGCSYFQDCNLFNFAPLVFQFTAPPPPFTLGDAGVNVTPRVALQGAMPDTGTLMNDDLRVAGYLPGTEPYSAMGYVYTDLSLNGAALDPSLLTVTGSDAIVDWVVVEIRDGSPPHGVLDSRPALVQRDGDVVDIDGDDYVNFFNLTAGDYRVAIRHRNHLGAMSGSSVALGLVPKEVDMVSTAASFYGTDATTLVNGVQCLWSGDASMDGELKYTGSANDRDVILVEIGGSVVTNVATGYAQTDINLDGLTKYTGANNDRDPILVNIGGSVPTNVRVEQLP